MNHGATTDVELAALVAGGVDTRQDLEILGEVGGAADGRHLLDLGGGDFFDRYLGLNFAFFNSVVGYCDGAEELGGGFEGDVSDNGLAFGNGNAIGIVFVAGKVDFEDIGAFVDFVDDEESVDVGGDGMTGAIEGDGGKGNGFTGFVVGECAFDGLGGERRETNCEDGKNDETFH